MITIRTASYEDAAVLARLNVTVHQLHAEAQPERYKPLRGDDPALIAEHEKRLADDNMRTVIAEVDGEPAGYAQCFLRDQPENVFLHASRVLHVDAISVQEVFQGQGVGQAIMRHLATYARELNAQGITLGVMVFNEQAIRFYEKLGFEYNSYRLLLKL